MSSVVDDSEKRRILDMARQRVGRLESEVQRTGIVLELGHMGIEIRRLRALVDHLAELLGDAHPREGCSLCSEPRLVLPDETEWLLSHYERVPKRWGQS